MQLEQALAQLDPSVDEHWTSDGSPRMDAVAAIMEDASVTRKMVTDAAPTLTRASAVERPAAAAPVECEYCESTEHESADCDAVEFVDEEEVAAELEVDEEHGTEEREEGGEEDTAEAPPQSDEEIENEVMAMQPQEIFGDPDLTAIASRAIDRKIVDATDRHEKAAEELRQLHAKCEICKRATLRHEANNPNRSKTTAVQAYINGQNKARALKVRRARSFIAAGTSAKDVAAELEGRSALDRAMSARKVKPENKRPAVRRPAGV